MYCSRFIRNALLNGALLAALSSAAHAQQGDAPDSVALSADAISPQIAGDQQKAKIPGQPGVPEKRIFGVLPNYRTAVVGTTYIPLTKTQKMYIAYKDTTDYPTYFIAAAFSGLNQWDSSNPSFGQGMSGYRKRFGSELIDQSLGNMLTEGVMPVLTHEDPRYFQMLEGTKKERTYYAMRQIFVTRTDTGKNTFNFSEIVGNAAATAFSNVYYRDNRDAMDNAEKFVTQTATDMISNVLKEFWPDIKRHYLHRQRAVDVSPLP